MADMRDQVAAVRRYLSASFPQVEISDGDGRTAFEKSAHAFMFEVPAGPGAKDRTLLVTFEVLRDLPVPSIEQLMRHCDVARYLRENGDIDIVMLKTDGVHLLPRG